MKKILVPVIACLALTGCHKKSAAEMARERKQAQKAYEKRIEKMYSHVETADYLIDYMSNSAMSPTYEKTSRQQNTTMSLFGRISGFSEKESSDFLKGKTKAYVITITSIKADNSLNSGSISCRITSKSLAKKIMDLNNGQYVKIRGKYSSGKIEAQFIDAVPEAELPSYIGTMPSWTAAKVKYQPMNVDRFIKMINKNPVREMNRLNGKYFTITGKTSTSRRTRDFIFRFNLNGTVRANKFSSPESLKVYLDGCKPAQKQMLDARIKGGQKVRVTGKLYWKSSSSMPQIVDVNSVSRG